MARVRTQHVCTDCGTATPKWVGQCPGCSEWNTLVEEVAEPTDPVVSLPTAARKAQPIPDIDGGDWVALPTGLDEADRVLGGGLVPGSVTLLGGEPGVGKSTLLLQMVGSYAARGHRALYITAEESAPQVRSRAERLGVLEPDLWLAAEHLVPNIAGQIAEVDPSVVVVDSIQTIHDPSLSSAPGAVAQVRHCAHTLVGQAKREGFALVLVGHVTKDGGLAGPRVLEHLVDTVLEFDGDRHRGLRSLRPAKHRFGSTDELGLFEMGPSGLQSVVDPSAVFLADRVPNEPGTVVVPTAEGRRPLLVEVQALVSQPNSGGRDRSSQGLDKGRVGLITTVLQQRLGFDLAGRDVHTAAVGGVTISEPGADLGIALAIGSAVARKAVPDDLVAFGEIGLAGELRRVANTERRLAEAARLGMRKAIVPRDTPEPPVGLELRRVASLMDAVRMAGILGD